jgi:hypothetical protein
MNSIVPDFCEKVRPKESFGVSHFHCAGTKLSQPEQCSSSVPCVCKLARVITRSEKRLVEACVWTNIAAKSGDEGAQTICDYAARELSAEDLDAAQKRVAMLYEEIQQSPVTK